MVRAAANPPMEANSCVTMRLMKITTHRACRRTLRERDAEPAGSACRLKTAASRRATIHDFLFSLSNWTKFAEKGTKPGRENASDSDGKEQDKAEWKKCGSVKRCGGKKIYRLRENHCEAIQDRMTWPEVAHEARGNQHHGDTRKEKGRVVPSLLTGEDGSDDPYTKADEGSKSGAGSGRTLVERHLHHKSFIETGLVYLNSYHRDVIPNQRFDSNQGLPNVWIPKNEKPPCPKPTVEKTGTGFTGPAGGCNSIAVARSA